jgi:hypothetical protein
VLYSGADAPHLLGYWAILLIFICALLTATALVLRRLDV